MRSREIRALDLFAGTGWGVALQARGIREAGVDNMPEVRATRAAAGMETIYSDVWDGLLGDDPVRFWHALQIASPPCQSFSLAGKGAGRAALDDVLRAIKEGAYRRPERLRALGAETDDRTALVLTPLAHVFRDRPLWVTWEQVPPVLPVWEACAEVLRGMGYSVWVGILRSEQYGVPQTRRRAVLIARADGIEAAPPTPTHSRYYEREPRRLDAGVLPWVSMAEALGWVAGVDPVAAHTRRSRAFTGAGRPDRSTSCPAPTVVGHDGHPRGGFEFVLPGEPRAVRTMTVAEAAALQSYPRRRGLSDRPAPTITGGGTETGGAEPIAKLARYTSLPSWEGDRGRLSTAEAAGLQSHPGGFPFAGTKGKQFLQIGNAVPPLMGGAIIDELLAPAALRALPEAVAA